MFSFSKSYLFSSWKYLDFSFVQNSFYCRVNPQTMTSVIRALPNARRLYLKPAPLTVPIWTNTREGRRQRHTVGGPTWDCHQNSSCLNFLFALYWRYWTCSDKKKHFAPRDDWEPGRWWKNCLGDGFCDNFNDRSCNRRLPSPNHVFRQVLWDNFLKDARFPPRQPPRHYSCLQAVPTQPRVGKLHH